MKVLLFGLDKNVLKDGSLVQKRLIALAEAVAETTPPGTPFGKGDTTPASEDIGTPFGKGDTTPTSEDGSTPFGKGELTVVVPGERDEQREISPHLVAYAVGGMKIVQWWKIWKNGKEILKMARPSLYLPLKNGGEDPSFAFDLITVQDTAYLALLAYFIARRFRIPLEVQVHGLEKFYGVRKWIAEFVLRRADTIRVVSDRLKVFLKSKILNLKSDIYVLPVYTQMTTPVPNFSEKVGDTPLIKGDKNEFTFLTVGRLVPMKNIALQIRAFARLEKEFPNARLRIVGDGPMRSNLQLTTYNLQLGDSVIFGGRQSELERFYQTVDAFLLTSDREGWGVAVTEAAYFGLPIIMTDVGLAGEFVKNGENGIVIPVGDENALVDAMKRVIENADLRARLGRSARRSFLALPSAEEQIRKQIEEWEKLRNR